MSHQSKVPSLKKFSAVIKLTTDSGARLEYVFGDTKTDAHKILLSALGELVRLACVAELENDVRREVEERIKAVAEWRANLSKEQTA